MNDKKLNKLRTLQRKGKKFIQNKSINYDILNNPWEQEMFFYRTVDKRQDDNSFDFIPSCLYLGEDISKIEN